MLPAKPFPAEMADAIINSLAWRHPHVDLHGVLDLTEPLDPGRLTQALTRLMEDFPVLGCCYAPGWWRDRWIPWDGRPADLIHAEDASPDLQSATLCQVTRTFDTRSAPPIRLAQLSHPGGCRLLVSAPHMVADGGGMKALLATLTAHLTGQTPATPPGNDRGLLQALRGIRARDLPRLFVELGREAIRPLSMLAVQRFKRTFAPGAGEPAPHWRTLRLEPETAQQFHAFCRQHGATINDGLVAATARMAARRADQGPVGVGYTIDLRRYLDPPLALVTNMHAVSQAVLARASMAAPDLAVRAASDYIGEQKRKLIGLSYALLPSLGMGWLPHGLLRWTGRKFISSLLGTMTRVLAMTNVGSMDEAVTPLGDQVQGASILGPFVHGLGIPTITATGYQGSLTLNVCASTTLAPEAVDSFADELDAELKNFQ